MSSQQVRVRAREVGTRGGEEGGGGSHLESQKEKKGLHGIKSSVHEVAHEQIIGRRAVPADLEELQHVEELAVDVAADGDRGKDFLHVALLHEHVDRPKAERPDLGLRQQLALPEPGDPRVQVA